MGNVYASADWHGCGKLAKIAMDFLQPDDKLYFLGDAIDRGPDGIAILKMLFNDPRVVFLKGNHEYMMEEFCRSCKSINDYHQKWEFDGLWGGNGGEKTFTDFISLTRKERKWYLDKIKNLPKEACYLNKNGKTIIMNHSGYMPNPYRKHDETLYFWDRDHFYDRWQSHSSVFRVHGHTPVQYLKFYYGYRGESKILTKEDMLEKKEFFSEQECTIKPNIIHYCDDHKIDIDMCTIFSKRIALLNLDTFDEIYID